MVLLYIIFSRNCIYCGCPRKEEGIRALTNQWPLGAKRLYTTPLRFNNADPSFLHGTDCRSAIIFHGDCRKNVMYKVGFTHSRGPRTQTFRRRIPFLFNFYVDNFITDLFCLELFVLNE